MIITAFLHFGTLDSTSALYLGVILNSKTTKEKHKITKKKTKRHKKKPQKDNCLQSENWNKEIEHHLVQPQLRTQIFGYFVPVHRWTE